MTTTQSVVLAVVEGLTEYLPISSTGHIILASWLLGINQEPFVKDFTVMVQFGAILAVVVLYGRRFFANFAMLWRVFVAFLPAAVIGLSFKKIIESFLGDVRVVAWALLIGGVLLVLTDHWVRRQVVRVRDLGALTSSRAAKIGFFQCLALIPGTSRSAATIWGGLFVGLSLPLATEFSFLLAVPTLSGATALEVFKTWRAIDSAQIHLLLIGNVVSFAVGLLTIRTFVRFIARFGLRYFGYYRILVGAAALLALAWGQSIVVV